MAKEIRFDAKSNPKHWSLWTCGFQFPYGFLLFLVGSTFYDLFYLFLFDDLHFIYIYTYINIYNIYIDMCVYIFCWEFDDDSFCFNHTEERVKGFWIRSTWLQAKKEGLILPLVDCGFWWLFSLGVREMRKSLSHLLERRWNNCLALDK